MFKAQQEGKDGKRRLNKDEMEEWGKSTLAATRREKPQVQFKDFELQMVIGRGTFGKVFLAKLKGEDKLYAIKSIRKDVLIEKD